MNDERLEELREKYKKRNLLVELKRGMYANHSGYTSEQKGEFLNWLCDMAYRELKRSPKVAHWVLSYDGIYWYGCSACGIKRAYKANYCPDCGARMVGGAE